MKTIEEYLTVIPHSTIGLSLLKLGELTRE